MLGVAVAAVLGVYGAYLWFSVSNASTSLGCDYLAYDGAARAWLAGHSPYVTTVLEGGVCGTYQYPPPFLLLVAPFTLLPPDAANWAWVALCAACLPLAVLAMPVPAPARLVTLALAGTSWPALFAIKTGAIGTLLLLLFALAWRWFDRPARLAAVTVLGGFAKLLPGLLAVWMLLTRRWRAAAITIGVGAGVGLVWLVVQPTVWLGFLSVERQVSDLVLVAPLNFAPASLAYFSGLSPDAARLVGLVHAAVLLGVAVAAALWRSPDASIIVAAIASQAVAPVLWDHYTIVVFLAVAWLLARRQWWAALFGVAVNAMLVLWFQPWQWVAVMDGAIAAVVVVDWWAARQRAAAPTIAVAPA